MQGLFGKDTGVSIKAIERSFSACKNDDFERVDLYEFMDWESFVKRDGASVGTFDADRIQHGMFEFKKYISAENYEKLCDLLLGSTTMSYVNYLFSSCNIVGYNKSYFTFGSDAAPVNSKIAHMNCTFKNCRIT